MQGTLPGATTTSLTESISTPDQVYDVCLIGAGLAGATSAHLLGQAGFKVLLIDHRPTVTPCFRAEKIEPDQAAYFRDFGLLEPLQPVITRIHRVINALGGRMFETVDLEQYGVHYHDMVNAVRRVVSEPTDVALGRATAVETSPSLQQVTLADGRRFRARLLVLATGTGGARLHEQVGLTRRMVSRQHSMAYGFSIASVSDDPFPFEAVTYFPRRLDQPIGYLTLFAIRDGLRANLFTFEGPKDPRVRAWLNDPRSELMRSFPGLKNVIGDFEVITPVKSFSIDLYVTEGVDRPGVVLIGDSFQSVCPATGTGLSKLLTDVHVLCRDCVPGWLTTQGMGAGKIHSFYADDRKRDADAYSLDSALTQRSVALDRSPRFRIFRTRLYGQRLLTETLRRIGLKDRHREASSPLADHLDVTT